MTVGVRNEPQHFIVADYGLLWVEHTTGHPAGGKVNKLCSIQGRAAVRKRWISWSHISPNEALQPTAPDGAAAELRR